MSMHGILIVTLAIALVVALAFVFLGVIRFDSLPMVVSGFVSLIVIFVFFAFSVQPGRPAWSAMWPIIRAAATFRHDPPAITADWRRLQAGHKLTEDQWAAFRHWVHREQEMRARRAVERIASSEVRHVD